MKILKRGNALKISVIFCILGLILLIPALASSTPNSENATWTTYGEFSANASTSGNQSSPNKVRISGNASGDDANVKLAGISRNSIAAGGYHSLAVKTDGKLYFNGSDNSYDQINVGSWTGIKTLATGINHTVGVKNDGTAVAVGKTTTQATEVTGWTDVIAAAVGDLHSLGLKSNGTAVTAGNSSKFRKNNFGQLNVSSWSNIKDITAGKYHSIGLKGDGTVVSAGSYQYIDGTVHDPEVSSWSNVVAISAGPNDTFGVKSDGTVLATGENTDKQTNVAGWSNIVAVAAGPKHTIGLKKDGTVVAAGDNTGGQGNVSLWKNVVAVAAGTDFTIGLKSDGSMLVTGGSNGPVATWTGVKQPDANYFSSGSLSGLTVETADLGDWGDISWNGSTPDGTTIKLKTRGAMSKEALAGAAWSEYYLASGSPVTTRDTKWLEIEADLETSNSGFTPTLDDISLTYDPVTDNTSPQVTDVQPSGTIDKDSATVTVYYNDSGSGIDSASVSVYVDGIKPGNCNITESSASCNVYDLAVGDHTISGSVSDYSGNASNIIGSFNVQPDTTPPVIGDVLPAGAINDDSATLTVYYSDTGSGIDTASVAVYFEYTENVLGSCNVTEESASCNVYDLAPGEHKFGGSVADQLGNKSEFSGSFNVIDNSQPDTTPPVIGDVLPSGTIETDSATLKVYYSDLESGIDTASVAVYFEYTENVLGSCNVTEESASCNVYDLDNGPHKFGGSVSDKYGNASTFSGEFTVAVSEPDTTPPVIGDVLPSGIINTDSATVSAYYNDPDPTSGIDTASVAVYLDNNKLTGCSVTASNASCGVYNLAIGEHIISGSVKDNAGNTSEITGGFTVDLPRDYFWTWYDSKSMRDWVLMANRDGAKDNLQFNLNIGGKAQQLSAVASQYYTGIVPEGNTLNASYAEVMGGPVKARSLSGDKAIVSQRTLMGNSLEEVLGTDREDLSSHFYWSWYDFKSNGYKNWILVSNPSDQPVYTKISFTNQPDGSAVNAQYQVPAGQNVNATFPGKMGGPVEVTTCSQAFASDGSCAQYAEVMASQRVLSNYGAAFNEVPGVPEAKLSDHYLWTWYDMASAGAKDWVLIANTNSFPVYAEIRVGGVLRWKGNIGSGKNATPSFPGIMGGAVEVNAWKAGTQETAKVLASQRSIFGPSFEEVPGFARDDLKSDYHWTWYDQRSAGATNWVLIYNPNPNPVTATVKVAGTPKWSGPIGSGRNVIPTFKGLMGGPVEVTSNNGPVMVSQRVLWNGHFNEVLGTVLD